MFHLLFSFSFFAVFSREIELSDTTFASKLNKFENLIQPNKIYIDSSHFSCIKTPIFISSESANALSGNMRKKFSSDYTLSNIQFENCSSTSENGGAIFAQNAHGKLININFMECSAVNGGACFISGGSVSFTKCNIFKCKSLKDGSAIFMNGATGSLENMSIVHNKAGRDGTIVALKGTVNIKDIKLYSNYAQNNYGGICFNQTGGVLLLIHFHNNGANGEIGRSMCVCSSPELIMENSYFHDSIPNQLASTDDSNVRFNNLYFKDNKPQDYTIKNGGGGEKFFVYIPTKAPTLPEIPEDIFKNALKWKIENKHFSWDRFYLIAFIFVIGFAIVIFIVPSLIAPPTKQFQWVSA